MHKLLTFLIVTFAAPGALAGQNDDTAAEVRAAVAAFNEAYAANDLAAYFGYYAEDARLYFYGARHDVSDYHDEWAEMIDAGGAVEKNDLSDVQIQLLPGGDAAIATYFVDYRLRAADGEVSATRAFESDVWQKIDGAWRVVNLHYSEIPAGQ